MTIHVDVVKDGVFPLPLPAGFYGVFVTKIGFAPTYAKVQVLAGKIGIANPESSEIAIEWHPHLYSR